MDKSNEKFVPVKIKKEKIDEEENINEFAETTMNELLCWYGYGTKRDEVSGNIVGSSSSNSHQESNSPDVTQSPKYTDGCEWCGKSVDETKGLSSSASGAIFCSELCFSQSRRANFKKNKTCDWCRHVRHTISYVDFQDGASQLQFCSTKCLNQYKMHIFCRETRAHLQMHPHLPDESITSSANLITPDLWLQNCKSPEPCDSISSNPDSPKITESQSQTSPLPLVTLTHPSKLMDTLRVYNKQKNSRKRCRSTVDASLESPLTDIPQDLRIRHTPPQSSQCCDELRFVKRDFIAPLRGSLSNGSAVGQHSEPTHCPSVPDPPLIKQPLPQSSSILPPVTIIIPYPIVIPIPLPIPIPIPMSKEDYEKLANKPDSVEKKAACCETKINAKQNGVEIYGKETNLDKLPTSSIISKPLRKRKRITVHTKDRTESTNKSKKIMPT